MLKKSWTYIFIFVLTLSNILGSIAAEPLKPEEGVMLALEKSEGKFQEVNINSYITLENQFISIDKARKICNDIAETLKIYNSRVNEDVEEDFSQITLNGLIDEGIHAVIILQSYELNDFKDSSIVIDIIGTDAEYDLNSICDKLREILSNYGEPKLNITLSAYYDGLIDTKEMKSKIKAMMKSLGARKVEGIEEDTLVSITGYTANIKDYIEIAGKKANINIATRFNSHENRTDIYIGTPLIVLEY